jgi:hypothetical protein
MFAIIQFRIFCLPDWYINTSNNKMYRIIILSLDLYRCESWPLTLRQDHRLRVDGGLLGCCSVYYFGCIATFRRNILPPSSGLKLYICISVLNVRSKTNCFLKANTEVFSRAKGKTVTEQYQLNSLSTACCESGLFLCFSIVELTVKVTSCCSQSFLIASSCSLCSSKIYYPVSVSIFSTITSFEIYLYGSEIW